MFSEEEIREWELLPLNVRVLTSQQMGAWLYYRDRDRDKRVNAELLDKFVARLKDYFVIPHDVSVIEQMAKEIKAEEVR